VRGAYGRLSDDRVSIPYVVTLGTDEPQRTDRLALPRQRAVAALHTDIIGSPLDQEPGCLIVSRSILHETIQDASFNLSVSALRALGQQGGKVSVDLRGVGTD
jgi:hypothetical protein